MMKYFTCLLFSFGFFVCKSLAAGDSLLVKSLIKNDTVLLKESFISKAEIFSFLRTVVQKEKYDELMQRDSSFDKSYKYTEEKFYRHFHYLRDSVFNFSEAEILEYRYFYIDSSFIRMALSENPRIKAESLRTIAEKFRVEYALLENSSCSIRLVTLQIHSQNRWKYLINFEHSFTLKQHSVTRLYREAFRKWLEEDMEFMVVPVVKDTSTGRSCERLMMTRHAAALSGLRNRVPEDRNLYVSTTVYDSLAEEDVHSEIFLLFTYFSHLQNLLRMNNSFGKDPDLEMYMREIVLHELFLRGRCYYAYVLPQKNTKLEDKELFFSSEDSVCIRR